MENPPQGLASGAKLGRYEVVKLLGKGGMGEVYLAKDLSLGREVALKVLPRELSQDRDRLARFEREARAAAALNHPNICTIHEVGESDGQPFIAMEYVEGRNLHDLASAGPMKLSDALDAGIQVADALSEAHKKHIVHRDIKGANIVLTPKKLVKVLDFGLAKELPAAEKDEISQAPTASLHTGPGVVLGTLTYMSPEQALSKKVDQRSDLFSFGVVLYEMLTGKLPFTGDSSGQVLDAVLHKDPPSVARFNDKVPDPLVRIVGKLLEKDPEERYQSAHDVCVDLKHVRDEVSGLRPPPQDLRRKPKWILSAVAIAITIVIAVCSWWGWHHWHTKQPAKVPVQPQKQEQKLVILVAPFWGQTPQALEEGKVMQALVERKLQETLGQEPDVTIMGKEIQEVPKSLADVKSLGLKLGAKDILWGEVLVLGKEMEVKYYLLSGRELRSVEPFYKDLAEPGQLAASEKKAEEVGNLALFTASFYYRAKGDYEKAIVLLKKIFPQTVRSLVYQGNNYANLGRWNEAENALAEAMKLDPKSCLPHIQRGVLLEKQHEPEKAAVEAQKAIDLEPGKSQGYWALGMFYCELQKFDKAIELENKAIEINPENEDAYLTLGQAYRSQKKLDEAAGNFKKAISCDPDYGWYHAELAKVYVMQGKLDDALAEYEKAIELDPRGNREFVGRYVQTLMSAGRDKEAISVIEKRIGSGKGDTYDHVFLYVAETQAGEANLARIHIKEYATALKGDAWIAPVVRLYAGQTSEESVLKAAQDQDAKKANEQMCQAYYYIGMQRLFGGDKAKARESFEKCIATGVRDLDEYDQAQRKLTKLK